MNIIKYVLPYEPREVEKPTIHTLKILVGASQTQIR
jgi:hypothetical protein